MNEDPPTMPPAEAAEQPVAEAADPAVAAEAAESAAGVAEPLPVVAEPAQPGSTVPRIAEPRVAEPRVAEAADPAEPVVVTPAADLAVVDRTPRPIIERIGLALIAVVLGSLFGVVAAAAWSGG